MSKTWREKDAILKAHTDRYLDHGFYVLSAIKAGRVAKANNVRLPKHGHESLVQIDGAWFWLARTQDQRRTVWSLRDAGGWRMENGRMVLRSED